MHTLSIYVPSIDLGWCCEQGFGRVWGEWKKNWPIGRRVGGNNPRKVTKIKLNVFRRLGNGIKRQVSVVRNVCV